MKSGAHIVFSSRQGTAIEGALAAIGQTDLHKTTACSLPYGCVEKSALDGQHVNARGVGGSGFIWCGHEKHEKLFALFFHLADVFDMRTIVVHSHRF
jgi:hypothetical protein